METIRVTSHLDKPVKGRYDGKDYVFVPEEPTLLSLEAAQHIFGLGDEDKAPALNKLGFLVPGKEGCTLEDALEKLDHFTFDQGRVTFDPDENEPGQTAKRTGGRRPHVPTGGVPAGGSQPPADNSGV